MRPRLLPIDKLQRSPLGSKLKSPLALLLVGLMIFTPTFAAANCKERAMIVFDASGSMGAPAEGLRRLDVARQAIDQVLPEVTATRDTGLVTYGGAFAFGCESVELRVPPVANSAGLIQSELLALEPSGQTPLSDATLLAAQTLATSNERGTIVVITDGRENCGLSACLLGAKLKAEAPHLTVHVIGFHLRSSIEATVACLAQITGGTYTATSDMDALTAALRKTLTCPHISSAPPTFSPTGRNWSAQQDGVSLRQAAMQ